jgi:hypothetical protein
VTAVLLAGSARAADTGNGSKNFRTPATVPNYFSNEAGPILGPTAETQRGSLYPGQAAEAPRQIATAPVPPARQHIAMAEPRGRLIRGRGGRLVAHHVIVHGRVVTRVAAHGIGRAHTTPVASRTTRVSSSHRHARG